MPSTTQSTLTNALRSTAHLLTDSARDYDPLLNLIGEARVVLLGEASHGTHEFYHNRAQITQRLIKEKGFSAVAVEGDWPDAYRVNRYVRSASERLRISSWRSLCEPYAKNLSITRAIKGAIEMTRSPCQSFLATHTVSVTNTSRTAG